MATNGILAVWSDIASEAEDDYTAWYEREHMFERLTVPGFRRARHYLTVSGSPKYFTYFELDSASVVSSAAYIEQANASSPWTRRVLPYFRNVNRTAFTVLRRLGRGFGALALTLRYDTLNGDGGGIIATLRDDLMPEIVTRPGIVAAQLWRIDTGATGLPSEDRELRGDDDSVSELALFVEGTSLDSLESLASSHFGQTRGGGVTPALGLHQLLTGAEADEAPSI